MSEAVNSVSTKVEPVNSNHAGRNAAIAGGVGLIGGGTAGYMTKQIFKDDKFTDEFVKELKNQTIDVVWEKEPAIKKVLLALRNLGENPATDKIKQFYMKHGKSMSLSEEQVKYICNLPDDKLVEEVNGLKQQGFEPIDKIATMIMETYDKTKKKFNLKNEFEDKKDLEGTAKAIKKSIGNIKGKAGAIWGIAAGAVLGVGAYVVSKLSGNKDA